MQYGVVKVEEDGSARFLVPSDRNIFFQVLDSNYMAIQTERTFVNFMPGEIRSCVGCHESQSHTPETAGRRTPMAMNRPAAVPGPQPGEVSGRRTLSYAADVQPVWDKYCIKCHSGEHPAGKLNLSGELTNLFNTSYEELVPQRKWWKRIYIDRGIVGKTIGENHMKVDNICYLPAKSLGSHTSVLVSMLTQGKVVLENSKDYARAKKLALKHKDIRLSKEELLKITNWIDINCQYYGSYYGKRNLRYKEYDDFRKEYDFETAISTTAPAPAVADKED